ncbi:CMD domain protein [Agromyces subbeticus]|uniref:CMD domain protein n=1 Tax=Agromyces subbeticus TaxID=293890 RepID=UPI0003B6F42E|nr:CMD domain protein [Agromyces subbeticus]
MTDIIDQLAGLAPGGTVDALRRHRPATRDNAQASYDALFTHFDEAHASLAERAAIAQFVAILHDDVPVGEHYVALNRRAGDGALVSTIATLAAAARTTGPYGEYPADGPLAPESVVGPRFAVDDEVRSVLGERLAAALEHAHLLVFRPRESSVAALAALGDAGWSTDGIVTLSQLVSFLAFQLRVAAGLRLLTTKDAA